MEVSVFLFLGFVGALTFYGAFVPGLDGGKRGLLSALSMFTWAIWTFAALDVQFVSHGEVLSHSYRELAFLGVGAAIIMLLFLVKAIFGQLDADPEETNNV